jgi:Cu(I)/Ag(I) efflux system membrane fusion protein
MTSRRYKKKMRKYPLDKLKKIKLLGIAILIVSVFAITYKSMNKEVNPGNDTVESIAQTRMPMADKAVGEKTNKEAMTMEEHKGMENQQVPKGYSDIDITPRKQQLIGVKTGEVAKRKLTRDIRTVGIIESNETKVARISIKFKGWINDVFVDYVGKYVARGEPLFTVYSPDLVSTEQEYLLALRAQDSFGKSSFPEISSSAKSLLEATRQRLLLWDIPESEIRRVERTGKPLKYLTLYSPITGFVMTREAFPQKMIMPNDVVFEITDLSTVWLLADIYEYEIPLIKVGQEATLTLSYVEDVFHGKVDYVYPTLETKTRTVKVRFEFKNDDTKLKPGMYANVDLRVPLGERLSVPEDAVINTGERFIVFIAKGDGYFEPRQIKVGHKALGYYEVLSGLKEGEKVVRSADFLIDSESRLQAALETFSGGMPGHGHGSAGPVSGVQKATPGDTNISLLTDSTMLGVGKNEVKLSLTDKDGNPIQDANVDVRFYMPPMPAMGMPAMNVSAEGKLSKDGLYTADVDIPMSGSWQVKVTVSRPGKSPVSRSFGINVR